MNIIHSVSYFVLHCHCIVCLAGLLAFMAVVVLMLVVAVIVWRPRDTIIYPMKHWKPVFRSLGWSPPMPHYTQWDDTHVPHKYDVIPFCTVIVLPCMSEMMMT